MLDWFATTSHGYGLKIHASIYSVNKYNQTIIPRKIVDEKSEESKRENKLWNPLSINHTAIVG